MEQLPLRPSSRILGQQDTDTQPLVGRATQEAHLTLGPTHPGCRRGDRSQGPG